MVEASNPKPVKISKQTSTEKYEQLMRECREMQERQKKRAEQIKKDDELVKKAQAAARSAINNYDDFKEEMGNILDDIAEQLVKKHGGNDQTRARAELE